VRRLPVIAGLLILVLFLFTACVAGPNEFVNTPDSDGDVAGFWRGLWHGIISPVTFIISLFSDTVHVYEVHNTGSWYDFGFLLGASIILGGSSGGAASRRKK
jgi:hypothetical protein